MLHFSVTHRGRLNQKTPAAKHVAYIMRDDEYGPAQAHLRYMTRDSDRTRSREDLLHKEAHNLPGWTEGNPAAFFAAAERHERANGRFCTTWILSLPRELSHEQNIACMQQFLQGQFGAKHVYAWAMHESHASDGGTNPHVHVIFSSRTLDGIERNEALFFKRYNAVSPETGGAKKEPFFTERRAVAMVRQAWSDVANWHLEQAGVTARIDPRTFQERGIDRAPGTHLGPKHSVPAKYQGWETAEWREMLRTGHAYAHAKPEEAAKAVRYWEDRKQALGMAPGRTAPEAFLQRVSERGARPAPAVRLGIEELRAREQTLEREIQHRERYVHRLHAEVMQEEYRQRTGRERSPAAERRMAALLDQSVQRGMELVDDDTPTGGVVFRFRDRERGRDVGF